MPGDHGLPKAIPNANIRLRIHGAGHASRLRVGNLGLTFTKYAYVSLADLQILIDRRTSGPAERMSFEACRVVELDGVHVSGPLGNNDSLVTINGGQEVVIRNCSLEGANRNVRDAVGNVFNGSEFAGFLAIDNEATFNERIAAPDASLDTINVRPVFTRRINSLGNALPRASRDTLTTFTANWPRAATPRARLDLLRNLRETLTIMRPTNTLVVNGPAACIQNTRIYGFLSMYGRSNGTVLTVRQLNDLRRGLARIQFESTGRSFRVESCRISRLVIGQVRFAELVALARRRRGSLAGLYDPFQCTSNEFLLANNQFLCQRASVASSLFNEARGRAAWLLGDTATYVGLQGPHDPPLVNLTRRSDAAGNVLTIN